ncbi:MAG: AAA family ATPase [bacterium]|nr:AAA family ATPase [Spirochaetales bacterium]MDT3389737.1 AAA family ATPase [bacterium]
MAELFDSSRVDMKSQPLAYRMRPRTLDEYIGQDHIIGPGRLLRRSIQADQLSSVIFYGPPGTGKTTLARVIANTTRSHFSTINAVLSGVKELREEIDAAKRRLDLYGTRTILFVDEVHRWNKSQQDALLPWVENGTFILIGATTENPFFEVNAALVSRSRIFQLKPLTSDDLTKIAWQAIRDKDRGYGKLDVSFEDGALEHLVDVASGDARSLLNALELAVVTTPRDGDKVYITKETAEESIQRKAVLYDKEGDYHFDVISAFIKSLRGSDPDAALYWLAKMVYAGEDPRFIFRRMMISACEDVGLADPNAIVVVQSDAAAFNAIGMPEGRYHLAHAALYLATAPKSNSEMGFFDALKAVEQESAAAEVPNHLRDASRDSKGFGHGEGYMYPHAYQDHWVAQQYLPNELQGKVFYNVGSIGYEKKIADLVNRRREIQLESVDINAFPENLTYSPDDRRDQWLRRTISGRSTALENMRDRMFRCLEIIRSDRVLVLNSGHGLLVWEAYRHTPEGLVVAHVRSTEESAYIQQYMKTLDSVSAPRLICDPDYEHALGNLDSSVEQGLLFEHIIGRNLLTDFRKAGKVLEAAKKRLAQKGDIVLCETVVSEASRLSDFIHMGPLQDTLLKAEKKIYAKVPTRDDMVKLLESEFSSVSVEDYRFTESRSARESDVQRWVRNSYLPALPDLSQTEAGKLEKELVSTLCAAPLMWKTSCLIVCLKDN